MWEESSTILRRGGRGRSGSGSGGADSASGDGDATDGSAAERARPSSTRDLAPSVTWTLPGDLGRRYGAASGDVNPIHMHSLSARVFGFRAAIAHGMWTKARCLAQLEPGLGEKLNVTVEFRKPILLPATVAFTCAEHDPVLGFAVSDAESRTRHLDGQLSFG